MSESTEAPEQTSAATPVEPRRVEGKPRAKKRPPAEPAKGEVHPLAKRLEVRTIHRNQIATAEYNPRTIDLSAKVKLKNGLQKFGLVEPLIWNCRNGRLVGGHQRLSIMDADLGHQDYTLDVSVVDLDETREKELNVLLNNGGAQGWWDPQKLAELVAGDKEFDVELAGFDVAGLKGFLESHADLKSLDLAHAFGDQSGDDAKADAEAIKDMKATKDEYKAIGGELAKDGFYLNVVAHAVSEKEKFCEAFGISPNAKSVYLRDLVVRLGGMGLEIDIGWQPPPDPERKA